MKTVIVWFRNDLRIHDHPALASAIADADYVVPLFIFDEVTLHGRHGGSNRNRFLLESLQDLKASLQKIDGDLVVRSGKPGYVLVDLVKETGASAVYASADYTSYALKRDKQVKDALDVGGVAQFRLFPGRLIVSSIDKLHTKSGSPHKVFTPFYKNWLQIGRREIADMPTKPVLPEMADYGTLPKLEDLTATSDLSPDVLKGGETAGRERAKTYLDGPVHDYRETNDKLAIEGTSRLSSYLHFGCISALELETQLPDSPGAEAWRRQLCWREFYHYVLYNFPANAKQEFQERFRAYDWDDDSKLLQAWQDGRTGYPIVDASMRQLRQEGWMHNRARLIVGSFLTKDLGLDWRLGESYFMRMLIDGDQANNNGNWQWIASVGVDPAPVFRRLYNPTSQQQKFDPEGVYVRRFVPELRDVPDTYLAEPWTMPEAMQAEAGCVIGKDYPAPVVDHKEARLVTLEKFRQTAAAANGTRSAAEPGEA